MKVIDPGHVYELETFGGEKQTIRFIKRSGGAAKHDEEWDGILTQELVRVIIDRLKYLDEELPCIESKDSLYFARMLIFLSEARAYRRKVDQANRTLNTHNDESRPRPWRENAFDDVPFNEISIENMPTGKDGHIVVDDKQASLF